MPRPHYIHRDEMLSQTGYMPARKEGEGSRQFEARKGQAASHAELRLGLTAYAVEGKRARRYRQDEVDAAVNRTVKRIAA